MITVRRPSRHALAAAATALILGASGVAVAQAATDADTAKSTELVPATSRPAASPQDSSTTQSVQNAARSQDGTCEVGELCLYYEYNFQGSGYDGAHNDFNLTNNHFIWAGAGQGQVVGNNARSYWNRDPRAPLYVCNYTYAPSVAPPAGGQCLRIDPNSSGNLPTGLADQEQSLYWVDSTNP